MMLLVGYGWAKPVPINTRYFRDPKKGMAITAAAGPAANLVIGTVSAVLYGICLAWYSFVFFSAGSEFLIMLAYWCTQLCLMSAFLNFVYMVFNLIPIPPFDGSRIALAFLPERTYFGIMRYERQIMLGLLVVLLVLSYAFDFSPFGFLAERLTDLIARPIAELFLRLFVKGL